MLYALIGSLGLGGIGTLIGFLKAATAKQAQIKAEASANAEAENSRRWKEENEAQREAYADQLSRRDKEIEILKHQREGLLDALEKSSVPGAVRQSLLVSLGVKAD